MSVSTQLRLEGLSYFVSLGCSESERAVSQEVHVSILVNFLTMPRACETDSLEDTLCYATVEKKVAEVCQLKSFKTIEHLAYLCWQSVSSICDPGIEILAQVRKVRPPIDRKNQGAVVEIKGFA